MKKLFYMGGSEFMGALTVLFIITTIWIVYHFLRAYTYKQASLEKSLKMIEYGKSIGLFTMIVGFLGQMMGFIAMFDAISLASFIEPKLIYNGIRVTLICPVYGILIYLFTLLLWFVASVLIQKKIE